MLKDTDVLYLVDPLTDILSEYVTILNENDPKGVSETVSRTEGIFLDFWLKHMMNMDGIVCLLPGMKANLYYKIPLAAILRSLTVDALTVAYLRSFEDDIKTLLNEINCLQKEFEHSKAKIVEIESGDEKIETVELNRSTLHNTSNHILVTPCIKKGKFLSEEMKRKHLQERGLFDESVKKVYLFNKLYTIYYHYSSIGGDLARGFDGREFFYMLESIFYSMEIFIKMMKEREMLSKEVVSELDRVLLSLGKLTFGYKYDE